jgi:hypothetical protein
MCHPWQQSLRGSFLHGGQIPETRRNLPFTMQFIGQCTARGERAIARDFLISSTRGAAEALFTKWSFLKADQIAVACFTSGAAILPFCSTGEAESVLTAIDKQSSPTGSTICTRDQLFMLCRRLVSVEHSFHTKLVTFPDAWLLRDVQTVAVFCAHAEQLILATSMNLSHKQM